jgi:hypothetical protein
LEEDFKHDEAGRRFEKIKTTKVELKTHSGWKELRIRHNIKGTENKERMVEEFKTQRGRRKISKP